MPLLVLMMSCASQPRIPKPDKWAGKVFAGDSEKGGVTRAQSGETILCTDKRWDSYLALTASDLRALLETYSLGCEKWRHDDKLIPVKEVMEKVSK